MQHPEDPLKFAKKSSSEDIVSYLRVLDHSYHAKGASPVSDTFYDTIKDTFKERFPDHPYLNEVGTSFFSSKNKVVLPYYMGSIDKIKADGPTLNRFIKNYSGEYLMSDKLDGISALYVVQPDKSEKLYTRGNGYEGQDITSFLPHLSFPSSSSDIRQKLREESKQTEKEIVMRGELIMTKEHFQHVKDKGANARNLVAGIMNSKTPDKKILSLIDFVPYTLIEPRIKPSQAVEWWQMRQITPVHAAEISAAQLNADYLTGLLAERRRDSPYEIDGIVITHDVYHPIVKGENPSYAFAFKSMIQDNVAEVVVKDVEWNISRNGKMVPVVLFDPVSLNGVIIKRTTGFNAQYIDKNVIGPGSRILITRSGDVIPFIVEVLTPSSSGRPMMPTVAYKWNDTKVDVFVENIAENKEVAVKNLIYFFTKIKVFGFSEMNIRKMYENGFEKPQDILFASLEDFQRIIGKANGEKICHQMVKMYDNIDFVTLMEASNSLGHGFGAKKINLIVDHIPKIATDAYVPTTGELVNIDGISDITAEQFISGLRKFHHFLGNNMRLASRINVSKRKTDKTDKTDKNEVKKVRKEDKENEKKKKDMENRVVLFTGFRDGDLVKEIESRGGKMAGAMSKKITDLVYKTYSDTSAKIKQAKEWGNIRLISYDELKRNIMNE